MREEHRRGMRDEGWGPSPRPGGPEWGPRTGRGPGRRGGERGGERGGVREHVARVGEQRQRVRDDAGRHLACHEREDQRERDREPLAVSAVRVQGARVGSDA